MRQAGLTVALISCVLWVANGEDCLAWMRCKPAERAATRDPATLAALCMEAGAIAATNSLQMADVEMVPAVRAICARAAAALANEQAQEGEAVWMAAPKSYMSVRLGLGVDSLWRALLASDWFREPVILRCLPLPMPVADGALLLSAMQSAGTPGYFVSALSKSAAGAAALNSVLLPGFLASPMLLGGRDASASSSAMMLQWRLRGDYGDGADVEVADGATHVVVLPLFGSARLAFAVHIRSQTPEDKLPLLRLDAPIESCMTSGAENVQVRRHSGAITPPNLVLLEPPTCANSTPSQRICAALSAAAANAGCLFASAPAAEVLAAGEAAVFPVSTLRDMTATITRAHNTTPLLWLEAPLRISALFVSGGHQPAANELAALVHGSTDNFTGTSGSRGRSGDVDSLPRATEALLRKWIESPTAVTLLSPFQPSASIGGVDRGARQRMLFTHRPGLGGATARAEASKGVAAIKHISASFCENEGDGSNNEAVLPAGSLWVLWGVLRRGAAAMGTGHGQLASEIVTFGTAPASPMLVWSDTGSEALRRGVLVLLTAWSPTVALFKAPARPPFASLFSHALSVRAIASDLARSNIRDVEELLQEGNDLLDDTSDGTGTPDIDEAALRSIRRVFLQRRDDRVGAQQASATPSTSPSASPSVSPPRVPEVHAAPSNSRREIIAVASNTDPTTVQAVAWDFIGHMQGVAAAGAARRRNSTFAAALAALRTLGDDITEANEVESSRYSLYLLGSFASDARAKGMSKALAGLALHVELLSWAASLSTASSQLSVKRGNGGSDDGGSGMGSRAAFFRAAACALDESRAEIVTGTRKAGSWLNRLQGAGSKHAGCANELADADAAAVYVPPLQLDVGRGDEPWTAVPPAPLQRLIDAGIVAVLTESRAQAPCPASASLLRSRVDATSFTEGALGPSPVRCVSVAELIHVAPSRNSFERWTANDLPLAAHIAPVDSNGLVGAFSGTALLTSEEPPTVAKPTARTRAGASHAVELRWQAGAKQTLGYAIARATRSLSADGTRGHSDDKVWRDVIIVPASAALPAVEHRPSHSPAPGSAAAVRSRWAAHARERGAQSSTAPGASRVASSAAQSAAAATASLHWTPGVVLVGLPVNASLLFRVAAITAAGLSEWSLPSQELAMRATPAAVAAGGRPLTSSSGAPYRTRAVLSAAGLIVPVERTSGNTSNASCANDGGGQSGFDWESHLRSPSTLSEGAAPDTPGDVVDSLASVVAFHAALSVAYAALASGADGSGSVCRGCQYQPAAGGETICVCLSASVACDLLAKSRSERSLIDPLEGLLQRSGAAGDLRLALVRLLTESPLLVPKYDSTKLSDRMSWAGSSFGTANESAAAFALAAVAEFWLAGSNATGRPMPDARLGCTENFDHHPDATENVASGTRAASSDSALSGVGGLAVFAAVRERRVNWLVKHAAACGVQPDDPATPAVTADVVHRRDYMALAAQAAADGPRAIASFLHDTAEAIALNTPISN